MSNLSEIDPAFVAEFLGGTTGDSAPTDSLDPVRLAAKRRPSLPIRLVVGTGDATVPPQAVAPLNDALAHDGADVDLVTLDGAGHDDILVRPETLSIILSVATKPTPAPSASP